MKISTIKFASNAEKEQVTIDYLVENKSGTIDMKKLVSFETPAPEFQDSLQALKPYFLDILGLPTDYGQTMSITGVRIVYKGEVEIYSISARKNLPKSNAPITIKTPPQPSFVEGDNDAIPVSDDALELLEDLKQHATEYCEGKRFRQVDLFEGSTEE